MSRFFRGGSDSDSDSSSDYSSSEDEKPKKPANAFAALGGDNSDSDSSASSSDDDSDYSDDAQAATTGDKPAAQKGYSKFVAGAGSSDDDDDSEGEGRRVVRSSKEKRLDDLRALVKAVAAAKKARDWVAIQTEFEKLTKLYQKSEGILRETGVPRFYTRFLVELEDYIKTAEANKAEIKKLDALPSRAFNALKQTLRKYVRPFASNIARFREHPVTEEQSADEAEDVAAAADGEVNDGDDDGFETVGRGGKTFKAKTETLFKQVQEIIEARGRKATDKNVQIKNLESLMEVAVSTYQKIKVFVALIPAQLDATITTPTSVSAYVPATTWNAACENTLKLMDLLEQNPHISLTYRELSLPEDEVLDTQITEKQPTELNVPVLSFIDRLDDEFTSSLQNIDPHTIEYVSRLKEETYMYAILARAQTFFEKQLAVKQKEAASKPKSKPKPTEIQPTLVRQQGSTESFSELNVLGSDDVETVTASIHLIKMRRLERVYYKPDIVIKAIDEQVRAKYPDLVTNLEAPDKLVEGLCISLYPCKMDRIRARALLCHVYNMALHDDYRGARDSILMSHAQDTVQKTDISTQILYNRTMVQIGFCAFRNGMIREAMYALQDIYSNDRMKELLAQGVQSFKFGEKNLEQEHLARMRQLPFHMHINLELLECIFLTCSMLLEIPNMARYQHDLRRKVISKPFRKHYISSVSKVFVGPPENTREKIMATAKFMSKGEWKEATEMMNSIKIWDLMSNAEQVKTMITEKIKLETLRAYIFSFAVPYYDSVSLKGLSEMVDLPIVTVRTTISRMVIREEIQAKLSPQTQTLIFYSTGQSRTHYLAETLADKIANTEFGRDFRSGPSAA